MSYRPGATFDFPDDVPIDAADAIDALLHTILNLPVWQYILLQTALTAIIDDDNA